MPVEVYEVYKEITFFVVTLSKFEENIAKAKLGSLDRSLRHQHIS